VVGGSNESLHCPDEESDPILRKGIPLQISFQKVEVFIGNSVELILEIKNLQSISIQFFCHQSLLYKIIVNQLQCAATEMAHLGRMDQMGRLLKNKAKWTEPLPVESDKKEDT